MAAVLIFKELNSCRWGLFFSILFPFIREFQRLHIADVMFNSSLDLFEQVEVVTDKPGLKIFGDAEHVVGNQNLTIGIGAVAGGVVGFLLLQRAGLFGMYESLDVDGLAGMAVMAPLCAVLAARFSLWLMRNQTR